MRRCAGPWPASTSLACAIWTGDALRRRSRITGQSGAGSVGGNQVFEMRAHRVRHPAQQHDRDVALAAFELGDIAFGNAGDLGQHLARHAAQGAHGADTLAELLEKAGFGIEIFGHVPCRCFGCGGDRLGNIMPTRIDSKRAQCLSMNYNSKSGEGRRDTLWLWERGMSGSSYNAVTWLLDRNVEQGRGDKTRLHRHRLRADLWRTAAAEPPRRQSAAPPRRSPRRARGDDHARHRRFPDGVSRRDPRRHRAGAAQYAFDLGSICLRAGRLPRPGAVRLRGAVSGRQGHRRADARSRARRRLRQVRVRPQATVRRTRARERCRLRPPPPMPTSRRSGCIRRARPACPRACATCTPIWRRPRTPTRDRCSASARTMCACRRPSCSSPMASATR